MPRARPRPMSEINVTPFVDVMLVMLIIFMVTAPLIQQGIDIQLPKTQSAGPTRPTRRTRLRRCAVTTTANSRPSSRATGR